MLREFGSVLVRKPQTVSEQVAAVLREAIADGTLRAETVLRQDDLAEQFGFSRMPIRDALRQLEAEGLVAIHPTKGAHVARMDREEIREIYDLRVLLEGEALRLSAPLLPAEKLEAAARLLDQLDTEKDVGRWGILNRNFHLTLHSLCGSNRLLSLIEAQHNVADRYVRILLSNLDYRNHSQSEHHELLSACRDHDATASVEILRKHLLDGRDTLVRAIAERQN